MSSLLGLPVITPPALNSSREINTQTSVQDGNIRQSHLYSIEVAKAHSPTQYYDYFVYKSIDRNGNGQICIPRNLNSVCTNIDDQISIEPSVGNPMTWAQFLYATDVVAQDFRLNGSSISASDVVIRPANLNYNIQSSNGAVFITVAYRDHGV
ncbi:glycoside hydrolase [Talaromyces proteolyticus]|uniref:Glycoside hydrolase n=1 Tax=Talaromyces proteolyticus TaxID=1131652 RepID=A0AAD4Q194_9EURO|nr:glycoside hydrolase [Talaromyces proteolyticus]KAH8705385.1 glycoside hydrolase [Talaromyces proteolyticus]